VPQAIFASVPDVVPVRSGFDVHDAIPIAVSNIINLEIPDQRIFTCCK
jgi:hypothetical protein